MKRILITGVNSYVGNSLAEWLNKKPDHYTVDKISLKDGSWRDKDFSRYDVVVHVAGIAHKKETKQNEHLYYKINRDLTFQIAHKARGENVGQFIFLSSMSVYGLNEGVIDENTPLTPTSHYGKSKLQAEKDIEALTTDSFKVAIVRPPMIYGKGCKGNYQRLRSLALKTPVFPDINNKRSMIYIDNLCEFIRNLIDKTKSNIFCPQNQEYVRTSEMVKLISKEHGKRLKLTSLFNRKINAMNIGTVQKVFGDLVYAEPLQDYKEIEALNFIDFQRSIKLTEE
ncbi:UDP-glucose 4-epimerase [Lentibacillus halodurans]|uniref:UDP-glucose 4-epimerase n=1 Tax=Lentibacillus halodurans TaxID=237679 RepID=A0A1I0XL65_9BACI|nr:NAD-dependent epimerase/dehydratase family protein [Lentibacillus halodurans]SFB00948.1 UDP-glucose 4-epimerase [Lentibacillus halodurans]